MTVAERIEEAIGTDDRDRLVEARRENVRLNRVIDHERQLRGVQLVELEAQLDDMLATVRRMMR